MGNAIRKLRKKKGYSEILNPTSNPGYQDEAHTCDICHCDVAQYYVVCFHKGVKHIVCGEQHYFDLVADNS